MKILQRVRSSVRPSAQPSGIGEIVLYYSTNILINADFNTGNFSIGNIPQDGSYLISAAFTFKNGTSDPPPASFQADYSFTNGSGVVSGPSPLFTLTGGLDQAYLVATSGYNPIDSQAGSPLLISYGAYGITFGSVNVAISVAVMRMA